MLIVLSCIGYCVDPRLWMWCNPAVLLPLLWLFQFRCCNRFRFTGVLAAGMTDRDLKQPASALTTARLLPTSPVVAAPKPIAGTTQTLSTTSPIAIRSNRSAVAAAGGGLLDPYAFPSDSFRMDVKSIASARPVPSGVHSLSFGALKANQPKSAPAANLKLLSPKASKKSTTNGHNSESRFTTDPDGMSDRH